MKASIYRCRPIIVLVVNVSCSIKLWMCGLVLVQPESSFVGLNFLCQFMYPVLMHHIEQLMNVNLIGGPKVWKHSAWPRWPILMNSSSTCLMSRHWTSCMNALTKSSAILIGPKGEPRFINRVLLHYMNFTRTCGKVSEQGEPSASYRWTGWDWEIPIEVQNFREIADFLWESLEYTSIQ